MLTDNQIRALMRRENNPLVIEPEPADNCFQSVSVELTLGGTLLRKIGNTGNHHETLEIGPRGFLLWPLQFILASTVERVIVPDDICMQVHGKSTLGRRGLFVHVTAGLAEPHFGGQVTLELFNCSSAPILLVPAMKICQVTFAQLTGKVDRLYGHPELHSHYQGQRGPTPPADDT